MGLEYGTGYQGIESVYIGKDQVLAKLSMPNSVSAMKDSFVLHPSIMDSALQASIGLMMGSGELKAALPFALNELEIIEKCTSSMWAFIRFSENSKAGDKLQKLDIDLCDDQGKICVRMKGFSARILDGQVGGADLKTIGTLMFEPIWKEEAVIQESTELIYDRHIVMLCELNDISQEIIEKQIKGIQCFILQSKQQEIEDRFQYYAVQLFEEVQRIIKNKPQGNVLLQVVVTTEEEQQLFSGLSGLLKTAQLENPKLIGQLIEVEPEEESQSLIEKLKENSRSPKDNQVRYHDSKRSIAILSEIEVPQNIEKIPWKDEGVYLVTGGAGGLGLIFAKEIAEKVKNATLILIGRSSLYEKTQAQLKEIEGLGTRVKYKQVDVKSKKAVISLMERIQEEYGKLNGIIHSAGVIRDNFILNKTKEELQDVLAPKVSGVVNLDQASKDMGLDFFILFSSVAGRLGNLGQADYATANAFMDGYARYRNHLVSTRQRQGQTLSINWPLWKDGGMRIDDETEKMMVKTTGMIPMQKPTGVQALYQGLASNKDQVMVAEGNLNKLWNYVNLVSRSYENKHPRENIRLSDDNIKEQTLHFVKQLLGSVIRLSPEKIQLETPFEKYGIDSIMQINIIRELEKVTGELSKTLLFEYSTTQELVDYLGKNYSDKISEWSSLERKELRKQTTQPQQNTPQLFSHRKNGVRFRGVEEDQLVEKQVSEDIAIIGISGRYPLSNNLEELWEHLKAGDNCITESPNHRWENSLSKEFSREGARPIDQRYYGGFLDGINRFDYRLFGIAREQVWEMSPETRLFLEAIWETFEDGGYNRFSLQEVQNRYQKGVGVFVGTMYSQYPWSIPSLEQAVLSSNVTDWQIANRTSHFFNLTGPSIAVNSACSSSLTAIHLACESLKQESCSMAIAGGVNLTLDTSKYTALQRTKFLGSGTQSKSFGIDDGYIPGEGVGAVLLKPLAMAIKDNDRIYAVIKSSFVNHGGGRQSYTAPDPKQQAQLIIDSIRRAGIDPGTIGYTEAAANGSELGDPIEVIALNNAFMKYTDKKQYCALGSVKSNLGHLEAASGISQLSKVLLQMKYKTLVPTINANPRNPNIKLEGTPFYLQEETKPWSQFKDQQTGKNLPRRSMINSFGAGGAYSNLVVEEFIEETFEKVPEKAFQQEVLIVFSAKTEWSLMRYLEKMQEVLKNNLFEIVDVARSLQKNNHNLENRVAIIASSISELLEKIDIFQKTGESAIVLNIYSSLHHRPDGNAMNSSVLQQALEKKDLRQLANYWIAGATIDFRQLNEKTKAPCVDLPKYVFEHDIEFDYNNYISIINKPKTELGDDFYLNLSEKISQGELSEDEVEKIIGIEIGRIKWMSN
jgi:polyketide synthase PksN